MYEIVHDLKELNGILTEQFSREKATVRSSLVVGLIEEIDSLTNPIGEVKHILASDEMTNLISSGHITIAMIKPRLDVHMDNLEAHLQGDPELADYLEGQIKTLTPVFSLSIQMTPEMVDEFYGRPQIDGSKSPKERMMSKEVVLGKTVWQEFQELMASGPVTFIVLYDEDGQAVEKWRKEMGTDFNVDRIKKSEPNSLRARFAKSMKNNLLHGSDSKSSAIIERNYILKILTNILTK